MFLLLIAIVLWGSTYRDFRNYAVGQVPLPGWTPDGSASWHTLMDTVLLALAATAFGLAVAAATPWPIPSPGVRYGRWSRFWRTAVVYLAANFVVLVIIKPIIGAAFGATSVGRNGDYPSGWGRLRMLIDFGARGGPVEEPVFVVLPVAVAALCAALIRWRWSVDAGRRVFLVLVLLAITGSALTRGAMHLYEGWGPALAGVLWGGAACLIYLIWRSLLGLIAAHVSYNVVFVGLLFPESSRAAVLIVIGVVTVAAIVVCLPLLVRMRLRMR